MIVLGFTAAMLLIASAAYLMNQAVVTLFVLFLWMAGLFIFRFQDHPAVREWVDKVF